MKRADVEAQYQAMGLATRYIIDDPGTVYEPHAHEGVYLFTLKGSAQVRLGDSGWQTVEPGDETHIKDNQRHEAVAGEKGWEYIFAATPQEMKRQGL